MRVACLFVPLFPLAARLRSEPALAGEAVAIASGNGGAARIVAASRAARRHGVRAGQTLAQARVILPRLLARGRDRECERTAQEALADLAERFSPKVESEGDGVVFLDATGLERHYVSAGEAGATTARGVDAPALTSDLAALCERRLANALEVAAAQEKLPVRVGLAGSKLAARVAAMQGDGPVVVRAGEEAAFLAPLPLSRLSPHLDLASTLDRWGIRTVGDLARLAEADVAARLGSAGQDLHGSARGLDPRPLVPRVPPPVFREGMDLDWPLVALEPFLAYAASALERLSSRLSAHGLAARRLELELRLEPEGHDARALELPAPTREPKTLGTLLRLELEKRPPGAPVAGFTILAHPDRPRRAQLALFGPPALSPDRLATALARLAALLGEDRVGTAAEVDSHRPEPFAVGAFDPPAPPDERRAPKNGRGLLAVRVLRPAEPLVVALEDAEPHPAMLRAVAVMHPLRHPERSEGSGGGHRAEPRTLTAAYRQDGPRGAEVPRHIALPDPSRAVAAIGRDDRPYETGTPQRIFRVAEAAPELPPPAPGDPRFRIASIRSVPDPEHPDAKPRIEGRVRISSGPWRLEDSWWSDESAARDYWDVELEGGGLYRIYLEPKTGKWFADGTYD